MMDGHSLAVMAAEAAATAKPFFQEEYFWAAMTAFVAAVTLPFIALQIRTTKRVAAYQFTLQEERIFDSPDMRLERMRFAKAWVSGQDRNELVHHSQEILAYFEKLGHILHDHAASLDFLWTQRSEYALYYWWLLQDYVAQLRYDAGDTTAFSEFEYLVKKMVSTSSKRGGSTRPEIDQCRGFLRSELDIHIRLFEPQDMDRVVAIENASFKTKRYEEKKFKELYRNYSQEFYVAEVVDHVVAYCLGAIKGTEAELHSIAVAPRYRRLGIGEQLTRRFLDHLSAQGVQMCYAWLASDNEVGRMFFEAQNFEGRSVADAKRIVPTTTKEEEAPYSARVAASQKLLSVSRKVQDSIDQARSTVLHRSALPYQEKEDQQNEAETEFLTICRRFVATMAKIENRGAASWPKGMSGLLCPHIAGWRISEFAPALTSGRTLRARCLVLTLEGDVLEVLLREPFRFQIRRRTSRSLTTNQPSLNTVVWVPERVIGSYPFGHRPFLDLESSIPKRIAELVVRYDAPWSEEHELRRPLPKPLASVAGKSAEAPNAARATAPCRPGPLHGN